MPFLRTGDQNVTINRNYTPKFQFQETWHIENRIEEL